MLNLKETIKTHPPKCYCTVRKQMALASLVGRLPSIISLVTTGRWVLMQQSQIQEEGESGW